MRKNMQFLTDNQFSGIRFFQNNAFLCEDFVLAGTRGWFADPCGENIPEETDYEKLTAREAGRLRLSLEAAKTLSADAGRNNLETLVCLHFPPVWNGCICRPITDILAEYQIRRVFFGHIHGNYTVPSSFSADGIRYALISADFLNFCPRPVLPELFFG